MRFKVADGCFVKAGMYDEAGHACDADEQLSPALVSGPWVGDGLGRSESKRGIGCR